jgi:taurine dioxygenase
MVTNRIEGNPTMPEYAVTPLTTTIGARIDGIDLRRPLPPEANSTIRQALATHCVLVFEKQAINLEQQKALASIFGPLDQILSHKLVGNHDTTVVLDNRLWATIEADKLPTTFMLKDEFPEWHIDSSYCPQVPSVGVLRAEILPPVGGGTIWTNMACAFAALSSTMQSWLETLEVVHAPPPGQRATLGVGSQPKQVQDIWERELAARKHPMVVVHPTSGRKVLFVNPAYVVKIDKLTNSESATLLRFLYHHAVRADFAYRHLWKEGDIIVWDELATLHLAPSDYLPHERRVVRVTAGLTTPTPVRRNETTRATT